MLAILVATAVAIGLMLALRGDDDGRNEDGGDTGALRGGPDSGLGHVGYPLPDWPERTPVPTAPAPTATPVPGHADVAEPAGGGGEATASAASERGEPEPQPEPAGGALVSDVALTFYTCVGDSTGAYCGTMASGQQVHRGAAACGYAWELGQRFRILADPYPDTIYICLDRGGGPNLWVDVWFYNATEGRAWRDHLPQTVTVEMIR